MRSALALLAVALGVTTVTALGCGAREDAALFVYVKNAELVRGENPFGSKLDGTFDVVFDLGKYTQGSVRVEAIQLGLYRGITRVVSSATIAPATGTNFPLELAPGQTHTVRYSVTRSQLTEAEVTELCAGPLTVNGAVKQVGAGELGLEGQTIAATGCP